MSKKAAGRAKGTGTLELRGRVWYARWIKDKKTFTRTTGTSDKREAEKKLAEFTAYFRLGDEKEIIEGMAAKISGLDSEIQRIEDAKPATSVRHGWAAYLEQTNRPDSGPVTLAQYESWYESFCKWVKKAFPDALEMRNVSKAIADKYAIELQKKVSATTFNRHINALTLIWRVLEETAKLPLNPWKQIMRKKFVAHSRRELTVEELARVINTASGEMRLLIALGIYTGLRLGDCASIRWDNIDMVKRIITVIPMKTARRTQKRVSVPIHDTLYGLLNEFPTSARKGYLLPKCNDRYNQFNAALAKDVLRLFENVNIVTKTAVQGAKRQRPDCGFHSLRHTFVSLCAAGGIPQSVVQSLVGHGSPAMTQHYTHIGTDTARAAIGALPDVTGKQLPTIIEADTTTGTLDTIRRKLEGLTEEQLIMVQQYIEKMEGQNK